MLCNKIEETERIVIGARISFTPGNFRHRYGSWPIWFDDDLNMVIFHQALRLPDGKATKLGIWLPRVNLYHLIFSLILD